MSLMEEEEEEACTQEWSERAPHVVVCSEVTLVHGVDDRPSLVLIPVFALQQLMACIGGIISIPMLTCTIICVTSIPEVTSYLINISMFVCGVGTILQNLIGTRLPIIQGASPNFLAPAASMMAAFRWKCDHQEEEMSSFTNQTSDATWLLAVREIQGNLMLASLTQVLIGGTGLVGFLLRYIGPLTIAPTISLIGLSLTPLLASMCQPHWGISAGTTLLLVVFALFLGKLDIPIPVYTRSKKCHFHRYPLLQVSPVLMAIVVMWVVCLTLTETGMLPTNSSLPAYQARTDTRLHVVSAANWFYLPIPGGFGVPTVSAAGYVGMLCATVASILESVGDYYASSRVSGCESPPAHAINRGIMVEGLASLLAGSLGAPHGVTSYSENIGAIVITKVASRCVFLTAGLLLTVCGLCGKFGAVVSLIPSPIIGGIATVTFGLVAAVGLSTLHFVALTSRNLMVIALSMILGLTLPHWVSNNHGTIQTGSEDLNHVLEVVLGSPMLVGCLVGFMLDNLAPGSATERGLLKWRGLTSDRAQTGSDKYSTYNIPLISRYIHRTGLCRWLPISPSYSGTCGGR